MNWKNLFLSLCIHSIKIGYFLLLALVIIGILVSKDLPYGDSFWKNLLCLGGIVLGGRLVCGGWSSYSLKGMSWSVIMSTIGALVFMIWGMKTGSSHSVHVWPIVITFAISITLGVTVYKFIDQYIDESTEYSVDTDGLIDSIFDNGIKNTASGIFNGLMNDAMDQLYASASRGVAAYSNSVFFVGLIVCAYYMV